MFDRCWLWRRRLSRWADGTLPPAQWGALQDHLAHCRRCQAIAQADEALTRALSTHTGLLDARAAAALDDRVIVAVLSVRPAVGVGRVGYGRGLLPAPNRTLPLVYLVQIMGGALTAAAVTALFLVPALHPAATARTHRNPADIERSEPPVPLGSLLQTASPRAALLWTTPQSSLPMTAPPADVAKPTHTISLPPPPAPRSAPSGDGQHQMMSGGQDILGS